MTEPVRKSARSGPGVSKRPSPLNGVLLVDKPVGVTSHDVVDHIRKAAGTRRVGHTGTLDPGATGLLIVCIGTATRLSEHLVGLDKTYEGYMRLGVVTDSYDMDGKVLEENPVPELTPEQIQRIFDEFTGPILQTPPMVSAVKVGGERLYKLARKGETIEREPRPVTVREFVLLGYEPPLIHFRVCCTRGTYVRSLCHDVGRRLGCGATLDTLRRTAVGKHRVENAAPMESFKTLEDVTARLMPLGEALDFPEVIVRPSGIKSIAAGNALRPRDLRTPCTAREGWVQLKSESGELLALAQVKRGLTDAFLHPKRVFIGTK